MPAADLDEGLVGALHDALAADVDPGARRHLAVHHEALAVELVEVLERGPVRHQVGVGDQHARRVGVRAEDADRLAGLHQQRLVAVERAQRRHDAVEALPVARGAADAAVDHELRGPLGHLGIEVVHEHAQRRLGQPALGRELGAARARMTRALSMRVMRSHLHGSPMARRGSATGCEQLGEGRQIVAELAAATLTLPHGGGRGIRTLGRPGGGREAPMKAALQSARWAVRSRRAPSARTRSSASLDLKGAWKSQPWQAASSSMATICVRFSAIGSSRRAACAAIDTWSSWLAEVGIESIAAGVGALLVLRRQRRGRHLRDHEAGVEARLGRQERRQAATAPGRPAWRCAARRASRSRQIASAMMSAANATGSAWKLPPESAMPLVGE